MDEEQQFIESYKSKLHDIICRIEAGDKTTSNYYDAFMCCNIINNDNKKQEVDTEKYVQLTIQSAWNDIETNNNASNAYKLLSLISQYKKDKEKMFLFITKAIELEPNNADYYITRGRFYDLNGQKNEARLDYNKACELDPQMAKHVELYGRIDKNINKIRVVKYLLIVLMIIYLVITIPGFFK